MDNNEKEPPLVVVIKLLVAVLPAFYFMYQQDQNFRWKVQQSIANVRYRLAFNGWKARVWNRLDSEQKKAYVELHGDPEA